MSSLYEGANLRRRMGRHAVSVVTGPKDSAVSFRTYRLTRGKVGLLRDAGVRLRYRIATLSCSSSNAAEARYRESTGAIHCLMDLARAVHISCGRPFLVLGDRNRAHTHA